MRSYRSHIIVQKLKLCCSFTLSSTVVTSGLTSGLSQGGIYSADSIKKCFDLKISLNITKYFHYIFMKHRCIAIFSYAKLKIDSTPSLKVTEGHMRWDI